MRLWPFSKRSKAESLGHPRDPALVKWLFGSRNTTSGVFVDAESVQRLIAVNSCIRVLTEDISSLPLHLIRQRGDVKEKMTGHPVERLIRRPNRWQTGSQFRAMILMHYLLRGNAYAEKIMFNNGRVSELVPLHPDRVRPFFAPDGNIAYEYRQQSGESRIILNTEMHHFADISDDILQGKSRIERARDALGHAIATEEYGARVFSNGAVPGALLKHPGKLSKEASERLINSWEARHQGVSNSHRPAVLEEGMSYEKIGITARDAQFLDSRKYNRSEIAGLFRVPPHKIADLDGATFSNIEQQSISYVVDAILPIVVRHEERLNLDLLTEKENETYYFKYNVAGILRGDINTRYTAYSIGRQHGWLNADDIREMEDLNPLPDGQGKAYLIPLNMVSADQINQNTGTDAQAGNSTTPKTE